MFLFILTQIFFSYLLAELASEILFLRTYLSFLILILAGDVILVSSTKNIPWSWGAHLPVEQRISSIQASGSLNIRMPSGLKNSEVDHTCFANGF